MSDPYPVPPARRESRWGPDPQQDPWRWGIPPAPRRTGRPSLLAMTGMVLVGMVVAVTGLALVLTPRTGGATPSAPDTPSAAGSPRAPSQVLPYFYPVVATSDTWPEPFGLALGEAVTVAETRGKQPIDRVVRFTPTGLRQVSVAATEYDEPPLSGRYVLIDLEVLPTGGPVSLTTSDFELLLPDGRRVQDSMIWSGWSDLFPETTLLRSGVPVRVSVVFDLPVGQDVLLVLTNSLDTLASWRIPGGQAPVVEPRTLPGFRPPVPVR